MLVCAATLAVQLKVTAAALGGLIETRKVAGLPSITIAALERAMLTCAGSFCGISAFAAAVPKEGVRPPPPPLGFTSVTVTVSAASFSVSARAISVMVALVPVKRSGFAVETSA